MYNSDIVQVILRFPGSDEDSRAALEKLCIQYIEQILSIIRVNIVVIVIFSSDFYTYKCI